jgi:aspartate/methionine/tyrosine aminotransferase
MPKAKSDPSASAAVQSPFARTTALIAGIPPGAEPVIDMSLGEPRHPMPAFLSERLGQALPSFGRYPPIRGTPEFRQAVAAWMARRYPGTAGAIDADAHVLPLCGSREGLFSAVFPALDRKRVKGRPAVLVPNPFYPAYAATAGHIELDAIPLPATRATGFLPDLEAITAADLSRAVAFYLASPSNPQGAVASPGYLARAIALTREHDLMLFADECYSEVYTGDPPPGALETALAHFGNLANVVVFQSLSKRSNLPGLRSGFCAGDPDFIASFATFRNVACPQMPLPVQHVSAAAWSDEAHVDASRDLYRAKFDLADRIIAERYGYRRPAGGFFLWLDLSAHGGGEQAAKTLWQRCGVKVVPGGYLAKQRPGEDNPGADFVRVAMVDDLATTEDGLRRIVATLG